MHLKLFFQTVSNISRANSGVAPCHLHFVPLVTWQQTLSHVYHAKYNSLAWNWQQCMLQWNGHLKVLKFL